MKNKKFIKMINDCKCLAVKIKGLKLGLTCGYATIDKAEFLKQLGTADFDDALFYKGSHAVILE